MSLLSMCQDVADVIGLTRPAAIMTAPDQVARQLLGFARETIEELGMMDWPILETPSTFDTVVGQTQYTLPNDFGREVGDTVFVATIYERARGSLSPGDWAQQRNILSSQLGRYRFRIFGYPPTLSFVAIPQTVETIVFEYATTNRVMQTGGALKSTWFSDDDVSIVDEDIVKRGIKWRMRRAKGLDYSEEFNDYEMARTQRLAQKLSMGSMAVAYRGLNDGNYLSFGYVPEQGYGS